MTNKSRKDALADEAIERALAPFAHLLSAEQLEEKRASLRLGLEFHPKAQDILNRLRARPVLQESAKVAVPGGEDEGAGGEKSSAGGVG